MGLDTVSSVETTFRILPGKQIHKIFGTIDTPETLRARNFSCHDKHTNGNY